MAELTCPKCHGPMRVYERNGVTVDSCTDCRGVFLDRGELERLIDAEGSYYEHNPGGRERRDTATTMMTTTTALREKGESSGGIGNILGELSGGHRSKQHGHHKKRKKKSFLEELFD